MNPKSEGYDFDDQQIVFDSAWDEVMSNLMKKEMLGIRLENVFGYIQNENDTYSKINGEGGGIQPDGSQTTKLFTATV